MITLVVAKDEGDFYFITTYTAADEAYIAAPGHKFGVPFDPNRKQAYGSLADARALAAEHGARLQVN